MISVSIQKQLGDFTLDMDFSSDARTIGFLGASGEGKSVTLRCIAGIMRPDHGSIVLNGRTLFDSDRHINLPPQKRKVGYLFQDYALFPNMTVEKNILCGLSGVKDRNEKRQRVADVIAQMHLEGLERHKPAQLSGGQAQRAALARILVSQPDLLLLDEPFSALDSYLKDRLQEELIQTLEDYPGAVIMVSHNRDELYRFSEEIVVLDKGHVDEHAETRELFEDPKTRTAAILTGCKNYSRATRLDDHTAELTDWGITLHTERVLPESFAWIGYRAHDFIPVYGEAEPNSFQMELLSEAELPFERNFYLKPQGTPDSDDPISWFVQREQWDALDEKGLPDYLRLEESKILYLT